MHYFDNYVLRTKMGLLHWLTAAPGLIYSNQEPQKRIDPGYTASGVTPSSTFRLIYSLRIDETSRIYLSVAQANYDRINNV